MTTDDELLASIAALTGYGRESRTVQAFVEVARDYGREAEARVRAPFERLRDEWRRHGADVAANEIDAALRGDR